MLVFKLSDWLINFSVNLCENFLVQWLREEIHMQEVGSLSPGGYVVDVYFSH